jgi:hypothetical protein
MTISARARPSSTSNVAAPKYGAGRPTATSVASKMHGTTPGTRGQTAFTPRRLAGKRTDANAEVGVLPLPLPRGQKHPAERQRKSGFPQRKTGFLLESSTEASPEADFDWFPPPVGTGNPARPCGTGPAAGESGIPQRQSGFPQRFGAESLNSGRN